MKDLLLTSSVLIAAVFLLRRLFSGRVCARLQYALWLLVLVRLLLPVSFGAARVSVQNLVRDADERAASRVVTYVNQTAPDPVPSEPAPAQSATAQPQYTQSAAAPQSQPEAQLTETARPVTLSDILRCAWYAGMSAMALWLIATNLVFRAPGKARPPNRVPRLQAAAVHNGGGGDALPFRRPAPRHIYHARGGLGAGDARAQRRARADALSPRRPHLGAASLPLPRPALV